MQYFNIIRYWHTSPRWCTAVLCNPDPMHKKMLSYCGFICVFLINNNVDYFFVCIPVSYCYNNTGFPTTKITYFYGFAGNWCGSASGYKSIDPCLFPVSYFPWANWPSSDSLLAAKAGAQHWSPITLGYFKFLLMTLLLMFQGTSRVQHP